MGSSSSKDGVYQPSSPALNDNHNASSNSSSHHQQRTGGNSSSNTPGNHTTTPQHNVIATPFYPGHNDGIKPSVSNSSIMDVETMDEKGRSSTTSTSLAMSTTMSGGGGTSGEDGMLSTDSTQHNFTTGTTTAVDDIVPMVFKWELGGRRVAIMGTFNGWSGSIPMHRSGNDFTHIANLTRGKHAYKYVVDDEWRFAPDQPTVADIEGNINNFIDVSDFIPLSDIENQQLLAESKQEAADQLYGRFMPDIEDYTKEPPPLPPHLRHIILNKIPPTIDVRLLPVPQHVALNHLYCTAIKDGMMVLGVTQRYKQKFVTTVYYSLMP